jgi:hypothetical protein
VILFFILFLVSFSGKTQTVVALTVPGAGSWTVPCNVTSVQVECWGAGGGGAGDNNIAANTSGSGGGGGGYCISTLAVTPGQVITYTVGVQGAGGAAGAPGLSGGNTLFSAVTGNGGAGGGINNGPGGAGGSGSGGTVTPGLAGQNGNTIINTSGSGGLAGNQGIGNGIGISADGNGNPGIPNTGGGGGGAQHIAAGTNIGGSGGSGKIKITFSQPGGTFTIGPTGTYPSITASIAALQCAAFSGPVIFELQPTYTDIFETYPLVFPVIPAASPVNTITYRPAAGATNIICDGDPGSGFSLITLDGINYLTLDGRPGGLGTTSQWTIRNTRTAAGAASVFYYSNDASNNTLTYLNLEGETAAVYSIIFFSTTAGTTGNDNNTISHCSLRDLTVGGTAAFPCTGIYSSGTAAKANSGNIIDNNQFVDIYNPSGALSSGIEIESNNDNWTMTNNHFYQGAAGYTNLITNPWTGIYINGGGGYVVTGNFIGGRAPNCGGGAFTVSSGTNQLEGIYFASAAGTACIVSGNTFANINYTTTATSAGIFPIIAFTLGGSVNYAFGSAGNGNTIGSMSVLNSIVATNNAGSGSPGFCGIFHNGTGTCSIAYNNFGGIKQQGTRADAEVDLVYLNTVSNVTITNNTFGSTIANNLEVASNSIFSAIYNAANTTGLNCSNNTFQNFSLSSASGTKNLYGVLNVVGPLTLLNNTFKNWTSAHNAICNLVRHNGGTTANVDGNIFQDITLSNAGATGILYCIYLNTASATLVNGNTIGSTTPGNILINGNGDNFMIYKTGTGSCSVTNNIIQGLSLPGGGASSGLEAVLGSQGTFTCTANTIKNITVNSTSISDFAAIWSSTASVGVFISNNTINNITYTNASATATRNQGVYLTNGSGAVTKNFISQLTNSSASAAAKIVGTEIFNGTWDFFNNVILLDNNAATNPLVINGIEIPSVNTIRIFHNTVKIFGAQVGNSNTACSFRTGNNIFTVKNNLFQNLRSGGTGGHYTEYVNPTTGTYTTDFNYLEAGDLTKLCNYGGVNKTLAAWKISTTANNSISGTTVLDGFGSPPAGFAGANVGTNLSAFVPDDRVGVARAAAPWMGGYEGPLSSLSTDPIVPTTLTRCTPFTITFTIGGTFSAGNIFTAELSSAAGSFASVTSIGSVTATTSVPISVIIPSSAAAGTFYRIRVVSSSPAIAGSDNGANLTIPVDGGAGIWNWTGTVSTDWFTPCNWDVKRLPDALSDVHIPSGTPFQPTITGAAANCNTLTIDSSTGSVLNIDSSGSGRINITQ